LDKYTGAAIFLLADQPNISVSLVDSLLSVTSVPKRQITAPSVNGRLANPVLFDGLLFLIYFKSRVIRGRAIFGKYSVEELEWNDPYAFLDVDTPDDYRKLRDTGIKLTISSPSQPQFALPYLGQKNPH
jgi:molybdenum cofactor cytidylyltransferase